MRGEVYDGRRPWPTPLRFLPSSRRHFPPSAEVARALDRAFPESHGQQPCVEEREKVAAAFDEVQIQRHEAQAARGAVLDDQAITAHHLLRPQEAAPLDEPGAKLVERPEG